MTDRNFKPDSGTDLVFEDAGSTDRIRITDGGSTILYEDGGSAALTIDTSGNVDIQGNELILDADGDTSITADTDDQIDFKTAGTDRATIDSSGMFTLSATGKVIEAGGNKDFVIAKDRIETGTSSAALSYMTIDLNANLTCAAHITQVYTGQYGGVGFYAGVHETFVTREYDGAYTITVKDSQIFRTTIIGVSGTGNVITLFYDTTAKTAENAIVTSMTTVKIVCGQETAGTPTFSLT